MSSEQKISVILGGNKRPWSLGESHDVERVNDDVVVHPRFPSRQPGYLIALPRARAPSDRCRQDVGS